MAESRGHGWLHTAVVLSQMGEHSQGEVRAGASKLTNTDVNSNSTTGLLCDLGQVTYLSEPVFSCV